MGKLAEINTEGAYKDEKMKMGNGEFWPLSTEEEVAMQVFKMVQNMNLEDTRDCGLAKKGRGGRGRRLMAGLVCKNKMYG